MAKKDYWLHDSTFALWNRVRKMRPETKYTLQSHVPGDPHFLLWFQWGMPSVASCIWTLVHSWSSYGTFHRWSLLEEVSHWGSFWGVIASPQLVFPLFPVCGWTVVRQHSLETMLSLGCAFSAIIVSLCSHKPKETLSSLSCLHQSALSQQ